MLQEREATAYYATVTKTMVSRAAVSVTVTLYPVQPSQQLQCTTTTYPNRFTTLSI